VGAMLAPRTVSMETMLSRIRRNVAPVKKTREPVRLTERKKLGRWKRKRGGVEAGLVEDCGTRSCTDGVALMLGFREFRRALGLSGGGGRYGNGRGGLPGIMRVRSGESLGLAHRMYNKGRNLDAVEAPSLMR
jgi:hypothetical protein